MQLTDISLIVLLGLLALVAFALVVAGVPRWDSSAANGATRAAQVIILNVLVVAVCGAALNDQYLFYSSWSDLLGSRSVSVQAQRGGTAAKVVSARVHGPGFSGMHTPGTLPPLPRPAARMQSYVVTGPRSGSRGQVLVYLPVGYTPGSAHQYPVILGLHGFPGGPGSFVSLNVLSTIDRLTAEHKMAPTIVVIPRIDTPTEVDTECVDGGPGQPKTDTWLAQDIPAFTVSHFRVRTQRTSWSVVGYSYGAWCAATISMHHPDLFGSSIVLLGYFRPDFEARYRPAAKYTGGDHDLVALAQKAPPPIAMWILTSREDSLSYPTTSKFLSIARPPLSVTAVVLRRGGHRNSVFLPFVPAALTWLVHTMPGFRPTTPPATAG